MRSDSLVSIFVLLVLISCEWCDTFWSSSNAMRRRISCTFFRYSPKRRCLTIDPIKVQVHQSELLVGLACLTVPQWLALLSLLYVHQEIDAEGMLALCDGWSWANLTSRSRCSDNLNSCHALFTQTLRQKENRGHHLHSNSSSVGNYIFIEPVHAAHIFVVCCNH